MMRSLKTRRNKGRPGRRNMGDRFRSNGHRSEMKITEHTKPRGSASHVYEKYCSLARDAMTAGDKVSAENFIQNEKLQTEVFGPFTMIVTCGNFQELNSLKKKLIIKLKQVKIGFYRKKNFLIKKKYIF